MFHSLAVSALLLANVALVAHTQESLITSCYATDPQINKCVKDEIQKIVPLLGSAGIPQLGVPPIEPLALPPLQLQSDGSRVSLSVLIRDGIISGLSSAVVDSVQVQPQAYNIHLKVHLEQPVVARGLFGVEGKAIMVPFSTESPTTVSLNNAAVDVTIQGHPVSSGRDIFMEVDTVDFKLVPGSIEADISQYFGGYQPLGEAANAFASEYGMEIFRSLQPSLQKSLGELVKTLANQYFLSVPYNSIFPTPVVYNLPFLYSAFN